MLTQTSTSDIHVRQAVRRGQFSADPFPYLFVTDLLPATLYEQLDEAWPVFEEMWLPSPTIGRIDFIDPRFKAPWARIDKTSLSQERLRLWEDFRALINGPFFEEAFGKFKPHLKGLGRELLTPPPVKNGRILDRLFRRKLDLSFWENATAASFIPRHQFLVNRKDLSVLSPHIDPVHFHFTLIMYFVSDTVHQHLGTTLFRQTGRGRARLPSETTNYDAQYAVQYGIKCKEARALPFLPNAGLLFLNGLHSWHGQHLSEPIERRTFNTFFSARTPDDALQPADVERLRQLEMI